MVKLKRNSVIRKLFNGSKKKIKNHRRELRNKEADYSQMLYDKNTPFAVTEAFKSIRTNLSYIAPNDRCPVFGIVSAYTHAGKSVIISNLALSFSQLKEKILLVDGDMRCPAVHRIFSLPNQCGISELLASRNDEDEFSRYINYSVRPNLDVITSGHIPPNPSELLASDKLRRFIAEAKKTYDYIFIDLPPVNEVTDSGVIANVVTGYLFAIRSCVTDSREVESALDAMKKTQARVVGFILNSVDLKDTDGYYTKYKRYTKYSKYRKRGKHGGCQN